jgi:hypothetical protein
MDANRSVSSEASEGSNGNISDGSPAFIYTAKTSDLTSRKGGVVKIEDAENRMISTKR